MSALSAGMSRPGDMILFLAAVLLAICFTHAAPVYEHDTTQLAELEGEPGCYYNFQYYQEGDRIITNEPCLNCTCHNRMLMCYLRVCPSFNKAIGQNCTVEKRPDQCCPVITCPEVPVQLLTSTTNSPATIGSTEIGAHDNYGCQVDNRFYADGAQLPTDPRNPCELCYCIRNRTTCVMQECTLRVAGCNPVYASGVCCPVKYNCDYDEELTTTVSPTTPGLIMTTTVAPGLSAPQCYHGQKIYNDGELIYSARACEHCYCFRGDIVCAVQDCSVVPLKLHGKHCTPLPPPKGKCCPTRYQCDGESTPTEIDEEPTFGPGLLPAQYPENEQATESNIPAFETPDEDDTQQQVDIFPGADNTIPAENGDTGSVTEGIIEQEPVHEDDIAPQTVKPTDESLLSEKTPTELPGGSKDEIKPEEIPIEPTVTDVKPEAEEKPIESDEGIEPTKIALPEQPVIIDEEHTVSETGEQEKEKEVIHGLNEDEQVQTPVVTDEGKPNENAQPTIDADGEKPIDSVTPTEGAISEDKVTEIESGPIETVSAEGPKSPEVTPDVQESEKESGEDEQKLETPAEIVPLIDDKLHVEPVSETEIPEDTTGGEQKISEVPEVSKPQATITSDGENPPTPAEEGSAEESAPATGSDEAAVEGSTVLPTEAVNAVTEGEKEPAVIIKETKPEDSGITVPEVPEESSSDNEPTPYDASTLKPTSDEESLEQEIEKVNVPEVTDEESNAVPDGQENIQKETPASDTIQPTKATEVKPIDDESTHVEEHPASEVPTVDKLPSEITTEAEGTKTQTEGTTVIEEQPIEPVVEEKQPGTLDEFAQPHEANIPEQGPAGIPTADRIPVHKAEDKDAVDEIQVTEVYDEVHHVHVPDSLTVDSQDKLPATYIPPAEPTTDSKIGSEQDVNEVLEQEVVPHEEQPIPIEHDVPIKPLIPEDTSSPELPHEQHEQIPHKQVEHEKPTETAQQPTKADQTVKQPLETDEQHKVDEHVVDKETKPVESDVQVPESPEQSTEIKETEQGHDNVPTIKPTESEESTDVEQHHVIAEDGSSPIETATEDEKESSESPISSDNVSEGGADLPLESVDTKKPADVSTDEEIPEISVVENKPLDSSVTEAEPTDDSVTEEKPIGSSDVESKPTETPASEEGPTKISTSAEESSTPSAAEKQPIQPTDEKPTEAVISEEHLTESSIPEEKPIEVTSGTEEKSTEESVAEEKPEEEPVVQEHETDVSVSAEEPTVIAEGGEKPADDHLVTEEGPTEASISQEKITEATIIRDKPIEEPVAEEKPTETTDIKEGPTETSVKEEKPDDESITNVKPIDTSDAEEKPIETAPVEEIGTQKIEKEGEPSDIGETPTEPSAADVGPTEETIINVPVAEEKPTESSDNEPSVPTIAEEKPTEISVAEEEVSTDSLAEQKPTDVSIIKEQPTETSIVEEMPTEISSIENKINNIPAAGDKAAEVPTSEEKTDEKVTTEEEITEAPITEEKETGLPAVEEKFPETSSIEQGIGGDSPANEKPSDVSSPEVETPNVLTDDQRPTEVSITDQKTIDVLVTEEKPTEISTPTQGVTDSSIAEEKPTKATITEQKPVDTFIAKDEEKVAESATANPTETSVTEDKLTKIPTGEEEPTEPSSIDEKQTESSTNFQEPTETTADKEGQPELSVLEEQRPAVIPEQEPTKIAPSATETSADLDKVTEPIIADENTEGPAEVSPTQSVISDTPVVSEISPEVSDTDEKTVELSTVQPTNALPAEEKPTEIVSTEGKITESISVESQPTGVPEAEENPSTEEGTEQIAIDEAKPSDASTVEVPGSTLKESEAPEEKPSEISEGDERPVEPSSHAEENPTEISSTDEKPKEPSVAVEEPTEASGEKPSEYPSLTEEKPNESTVVDEKPTESSAEEEKPTKSVVPQEEKVPEISVSEEKPIEPSNEEETPIETTPVENEPIEPLISEEQPISNIVPEQKPSESPQPEEETNVPAEVPTKSTEEAQVPVQPSETEQEPIKPEQPESAETPIENEGEEQVTVEHERPELFGGNFPSSIPGEGNCLVDGQSFANNSAIPPANLCQIRCLCISSIVHCDLVECSPPPAHLSNCMPVHTNSDSCCPIYSCDSVPTPVLESDSQMAEHHTPGYEGITKPTVTIEEETPGQISPIDENVKEPGTVVEGYPVEPSGEVKPSSVVPTYLPVDVNITPSAEPSAGVEDQKTVKPVEEEVIKSTRPEQEKPGSLETNEIPEQPGTHNVEESAKPEVVTESASPIEPQTEEVITPTEEQKIVLPVEVPESPEKTDAADTEPTITSSPAVEGNIETVDEHASVPPASNDDQSLIPVSTVTDISAPVDEHETEISITEPENPVEPVVTEGEKPSDVEESQEPAVEIEKDTIQPSLPTSDNDIPEGPVTPSEMPVDNEAVKPNEEPTATIPAEAAHEEEVTDIVKPVQEDTDKPVVSDSESEAEHAAESPQPGSTVATEDHPDQTQHVESPVVESSEPTPGLIESDTDVQTNVPVIQDTEKITPLIDEQPEKHVPEIQPEFDGQVIETIKPVDESAHPTKESDSQHTETETSVAPVDSSTSENIPDIKTPETEELTPILPEQGEGIKSEESPVTPLLNGGEEASAVTPSTENDIALAQGPTTSPAGQANIETPTSVPSTNQNNEEISATETSGKVDTEGPVSGEHDEQKIIVPIDQLAGEKESHVDSETGVEKEPVVDSALPDSTKETTPETGIQEGTASVEKQPAEPISPEVPITSEIEGEKLVPVELTTIEPESHDDGETVASTGSTEVQDTDSEITSAPITPDHVESSEPTLSVEGKPVEPEGSTQEILPVSLDEQTKPQIHEEEQEKPTAETDLPEIAESPAPTSTQEPESPAEEQPAVGPITTDNVELEAASPVTPNLEGESVATEQTIEPASPEQDVKISEPEANVEEHTSSTLEHAAGPALPENVETPEPTINEESGTVTDERIGEIPHSSAEPSKPVTQTEGQTIEDEESQPVTPQHTETETSPISGEKETTAEEQPATEVLSHEVTGTPLLIENAEEPTGPTQESEPKPIIPDRTETSEEKEPIDSQQGVTESESHDDMEKPVPTESVQKQPLPTDQSVVGPILIDKTETPASTVGDEETSISFESPITNEPESDDQTKLTPTGVTPEDHDLAIDTIASTSTPSEGSETSVPVEKHDEVIPVDLSTAGPVISEEDAAAIVPTANTNTQPAETEVPISGPVKTDHTVSEGDENIAAEHPTDGPISHDNVEPLVPTSEPVSHDETETSEPTAGAVSHDEIEATAEPVSHDGIETPTPTVESVSHGDSEVPAPIGDTADQTIIPEEPTVGPVSPDHAEAPEPTPSQEDGIIESEKPTVEPAAHDDTETPAPTEGTHDEPTVIKEEYPESTPAEHVETPAPTVADEKEPVVAEHPEEEISSSLEPGHDEPTVEKETPETPKPIGQETVSDLTPEVSTVHTIPEEVPTQSTVSESGKPSDSEVVSTDEPVGQEKLPVDSVTPTEEKPEEKPSVLEPEYPTKTSESDLAPATEISGEPAPEKPSIIEESPVKEQKPTLPEEESLENINKDISTEEKPSDAKIPEDEKPVISAQTELPIREHATENEATIPVESAPSQKPEQVDEDDQQQVQILDHNEEIPEEPTVDDTEGQLIIGPNDDKITEDHSVKDTKPSSKPSYFEHPITSTLAPQGSLAYPDQTVTGDDNSHFPVESGSYLPHNTDEADDYDEDDQEIYGPGTCRYGGKVYVSAQQIPRDDPCDFCFCFRSDIICLQQSCPPPIPGCHEEPINGFCCPRYECPVSMATSLNLTTTTTTTTTTLPPHFLSHAYKGAAKRSGCQIRGQAYQVGEVIPSASGPCLQCTCGGDGNMKCDPRVCTPEPMLRQMIAAATARRRR